MIDTLQPFAVALAIGLLIGIERERAHPPGVQALGLRSFVLLALLGALAAHVDAPLVAGGLTLFAGAAVLAGYLRSTPGAGAERDIGLTTELAALVTFALAFTARRDPLLALMLSVALLLLLLGRARLHEFSRAQLRPEEIHAASTILVLALGLLPLLPDHTIDPWDLVNPRKLTLLVVLIAGMQFAGYAAARIGGVARGVPLAGFFAGFVSSTAATVTFPRVAREQPKLAAVAAAAVMLATVAMLTSLLALLFAASAPLARAATPMLLGASLAGAAAAWLASRHGPSPADDAKSALPSNPLALRSAVRLALVLSALIAVVSLARRAFGTAGVDAVSFLAGLAETHGVALALANLEARGSLETHAALEALGMALGASFVTKLAITAWVARGRYVAILFAGLVAMIAAGGAGYWVSARG